MWVWRNARLLMSPPHIAATMERVLFIAEFCFRGVPDGDLALFEVLTLALLFEPAEVAFAACCQP